MAAGNAAPGAHRGHRAVGAGAVAALVAGLLSCILTGPAVTGAAARHAAAGGFRLVFDATFPSPTLDTALWHTCYDFGACRISTNTEYEWYVPSADTVSGGHLVLTATEQETDGQPYASGMVQSNGRFDFLYGRIVVVAKVPAGYGTWPALWLLPADGAWPPEIDIMEAWGSEPGLVRQSVFLPTDRLGIHRKVPVANLTTRFHSFAVDWEPGVIRWYVDGQLTLSLRVRIDTPMYPIANLAVSDPPGPLTAATFPASFLVSSIRVYQHPGVGAYLCSSACEHAAGATG